MQVNRRGFLFAGGAAAVPFVFTGCSNLLKFGSNEKIRVGVVGLGRISSSFEMPCLVRKLADRARIVAICDLDARRLAFAKERLEKQYRGKGAGFEGYTVDAYHDYKELCARKDVDAVMVCVPDFWHALVASTVLASGKALWLQKPFTQTIREGRILANLAKRKGCVVQVGSQQRSWEQFKAVCELASSGAIGKIKRVEVGLGVDVSGGCSKPEPVPATFDYKTWLGPTDPTAPYNWTRCHQQDLKKIGDRPGWIQLAPYGWGMITNWGAHHLDIVQWGLGKELTGPDRVEGTCKWMDLSGGKLWNVHTTYDLHYTYGKTDVHLWDGYQCGVKFVGEDDWLYCARGSAKVTPSDPDVPKKPGQYGPIAASRNALLPTLRGQGYFDVEVEHVRNWIDAIEKNDPALTVTNAERAHRSTSVCSLGQMCMTLGAPINWDPAKETTGTAAGDALMTPFAQGKFDLRVNLAEFGLDYDELLKA